MTKAEWMDQLRHFFYVLTSDSCNLHTAKTNEGDTQNIIYLSKVDFIFFFFIQPITLIKYRSEVWWYCVVYILHFSLWKMNFLNGLVSFFFPPFSKTIHYLFQLHIELNYCIQNIYTKKTKSLLVIPFFPFKTLHLCLLRLPLKFIYFT